MREHQFSINCPPRIGKIPWGLLSQNVQTHWAVKAEVTRYWRTITRIMARGLPPMRRARIKIVFHKNNARRYDPGNLYPVSKAIVDGVVDAGVLPDDSAEFVEGPDPRAGEKTITPHVVITITELEEP